MTKIRAFEFIPLEQWRFTHRAKVQLARQKAKDVAKKDFQFKNLEYQIDEYLRQWILRELVERYNYSEEYLAVDELVQTSESSKIASIAIKNGKNEVIALVSTGYFGETDLDFENACHKLQNDLDTIRTAFFGMVTDGRRLTCLVKSDGESITDCQTVEDFPTFEQIREFGSIGTVPSLKPAAHRFQKLPAPKIPVSAKSAAGGAHKKARQNAQPIFVKADANYLPAHAAKTSRSAASMIGFVVCVLILVLGGAWYAGAFSRGGQMNVSSETIAETETVKPATTETKVKTDAPAAAVPRTTQPASPNNGPTTYDEVQPAPQTAARPGKQTKNKASRSLNPDGSVRLSNDEIVIMQTRPAANPNAAQPKVHAQPKVSTQPQSTAQSGTMQKKRQMVQTPY